MIFENEMAIQKFWAANPFEGHVLKSTCNHTLKVLHPGFLNNGSGPDFSDAQIQIDAFTWFGSVEIHAKSSEWNDHRHQFDPAYNNVILHVVIVHDKEVYKQNGDCPVVLQLPQFNSAVPDRQIHNIMYDISALTDAAEKRLKRKARELQLLPEAISGDQEALFHRLLFSAYGIRNNILPFEQLAVATPISILRRERASLAAVEALLYGQSGLLNDQLKDPYCRDLIGRYTMLRNKYRLQPMNPVSWKQMRMRPANFPCVRISQLAGFSVRCDRPMNTFMNESDPNVLRNVLFTEAGEYWNSHYRFDVFSPGNTKQTGDTFLDAILINAVAVMKYYLGELYAEGNLRKDAIALLESLPPERNSLIASAGINCNNAWESQGVLELIRERGY